MAQLVVEVEIGPIKLKQAMDLENQIHGLEINHSSDR